MINGDLYTTNTTVLDCVYQYIADYFKTFQTSVIQLISYSPLKVRNTSYGISEKRSCERYQKK